MIYINDNTLTLIMIIAVYIYGGIINSQHYTTMIGYRIFFWPFYVLKSIYKDITQ